MGKGLDRKKAKKEQVGGSSHVGAQRMYAAADFVLLQEVVGVAHLTLLATAVRPPPHFLSSLSHD